MSQGPFDTGHDGRVPLQPNQQVYPQVAAFNNYAAVQPGMPVCHGPSVYASSPYGLPSAGPYAAAPGAAPVPPFGSSTPPSYAIPHARMMSPMGVHGMVPMHPAGGPMVPGMPTPYAAASGSSAAEYGYSHEVANRSSKHAVSSSSLGSASGVSHIEDDAAWQANFEQYCKTWPALLQRRGEIVPSNYVKAMQSGPLADWCALQRRLARNGRLPPERLQQLNDVNFEWDASEAKWDEFYCQLRQHWERHHTCAPVKDDRFDDALERWISAQRKRKRDGTLPEHRIQLLNSIAFDWNPDQSKWLQMYQDLLEYRNRFGDCDVPQRWTENPSLGSWVNFQRKKFRKGKMDPWRKVMLESVGFKWALK